MKLRARSTRSRASGDSETSSPKAAASVCASVNETPSSSIIKCPFLEAHASFFLGAHASLRAGLRLKANFRRLRTQGCVRSQECARSQDIKLQSPRDQLGSRGLCIVNWFRQPQELSNRYGPQREPG